MGSETGSDKSSDYEPTEEQPGEQQLDDEDEDALHEAHQSDEEEDGPVEEYNSDTEDDEPYEDRVRIRA
eukprot:8610939-Pyramimonas_sp.AAC.2